MRIAFKEFEMGFKFSFGSIDPTDGTLAKSQRDKVVKMNDWVDSPFHEYQCNKCHNHYVLAKKHKKVKCTNCGTAWANRSCSFERVHNKSKH